MLKLKEVIKNLDREKVEAKRINVVWLERPIYIVKSS